MASFAVEVPGAACPLSFDDVCRVLQLATSQDQTQRSAAGEQLKTWEGTDGYLSGLQVCWGVGSQQKLPDIRR